MALYILLPPSSFKTLLKPEQELQLDRKREAEICKKDVISLPHPPYSFPCKSFQVYASDPATSFIHYDEI